MPETEVNMSIPSKVILLCCGSFNPITNMHLRMFELAKDALHRTGKYCVVGGIVSPVNDAYGKKDLVTAKHRCAMIRLALQSSEWIRLDTWESEQEKWNRTAQVLRHHREALESSYNANSVPNTPTKRRKINSENDSADYAIPSHLYNINDGPVQLKLLCGADLLESFGQKDLWAENDIEDIVGRYGLVCINRAGSNPERFIYESDVLYKHQNNILLVTEWIHNDISSTKIRRALRRGESVKYLVQDPVIDYINAHHLYGSGDNKYMNKFTPSPNRDDQPDFDLPPPPPPIEMIPETNYLMPLHRTSYQRLDNQDFATSENSSVESLKHTRSQSPQRPVTCMGADITGLVRRVKNMRVAVTPETCV